jgi:hypothetical protein
MMKMPEIGGSAKETSAIRKNGNRYFKYELLGSTNLQHSNDVKSTKHLILFISLKGREAQVPTRFAWKFCYDRWLKIP